MLNVAALNGRLTADPELRHTSGRHSRHVVHPRGGPRLCQGGQRASGGFHRYRLLARHRRIRVQIFSQRPACGRRGLHPDKELHRQPGREAQGHRNSGEQGRFRRIQKRQRLLRSELCIRPGEHAQPDEKPAAPDQSDSGDFVEIAGDDDLPF
jgi:single-stranded DNA-binding protein